MPERSAHAVWRGGLRDGKGNVRTASGVLDAQYSFSTRFEEGNGTNPEELIGAAHAGCFSMALAAALEKAGFKPRSVETTARVTLAKAAEGFAISRIDLDTRVNVSDIDDAALHETAEKAKETCPVSKALASVPITLAIARVT
jgi:osmotically inducible protein OsmC